MNDNIMMISTAQVRSDESAAPAPSSADTGTQQMIVPDHTGSSAVTSSTEILLYPQSVWSARFRDVCCCPRKTARVRNGSNLNRVGYIGIFITTVLLMAWALNGHSSADTIMGLYAGIGGALAYYLAFAFLFDKFRNEKETCAGTVSLLLIFVATITLGIGVRGIIFYSSITLKDPAGLNTVQQFVGSQYAFHLTDTQPVTSMGFHRHWAVPCGDWDVCDGSRREKNPNGGEDLAAYDQWVCPLFDGESVRKDQLYVSAPPSIWLVNEQTGFSGWTYWAMRPRFSTKQDYETTILEAIQSSGFCGNGSCTLPNPVHLLLDHDPTVKMKYYTTMGIVSASFVAVFLAKFTYYLC